MKKHIALALISSTLLAGSALAQSNTSNSGNTSASTASSANAGRFITEQPANEVRASKLIGVAVYGADNQRIGDINEVLLDKSGAARAVVVGVGGFLGIGEKNVAVAYSSLEWSNQPVGSSGQASNNNQAPTNTASTTTNVVNSASNAAGAVTDRASNAVNNTGNTAASAAHNTASNGYPDHAVLRFTKADLQNAPTFRYYADRANDTNANRPANTTGTGTGTNTTGTGVAPAGTAPAR